MKWGVGMLKVNNTLLEKLFLCPNPQPQRKDVKYIYNLLFERMFPHHEDFTEFLSAQSIDKQYEVSQQIMQRLCYYANFPPSYYALTDVISVESFQEKNIRETDRHIPRDHFIHLVYLYLLGIYIFFYNAEFYNALISLNRFERKGVSPEVPSLGAVKDFLSEWKYFCIYHDVGYPSEILGNKEQFNQQHRNKVNLIKELKATQLEFKGSLGKGMILKQQAYFGSIEVIAKLLFAQLVTDNSHEKIDSNHKFFRIFKEEHLYISNDKGRDFQFGDIDEKLYSGVVLEKVYSNKCLKILAPIIGINRIAVIGIEKKHGTVCFLSYDENNVRRFVFTEFIKNNDEFIAILNDPQIMLFDDYTSENFDFIYVLRTSKDGFANISVVEEKYFRKLYSIIKSEFENRYRSVSRESQFLDFSFLIYQWFLERIRNSFDGTNLSDFVEKQFSQINSGNVNNNDILIQYERSKKIRSIIFSDAHKYEDLMVRKSKEIFSGFVEKKMGKIGKYSDLDDLIEESIKRYKRATFSVVNSKRTLQQLEYELRHEVENEIEGEIDTLQLFSQVFLCIRELLETKETVFSYDYISNFIDIPIFLDEEIKVKIKEKMGFSGINKVIDEYELKHGITVDHGVASACYAASVFDCYRTALKRNADNEKGLLLSVLLDIPDSIESSKVRYIDNYDHVFCNVLFAIFVHNLYPDHFATGSKGKQYRAHISDPFTYLGLLCDTLQTWNRPKSLQKSMLGYKSVPNVSEDYNIIVDEDRILISDHGNQNKNWGTEFVASMRQYLCNIDAFVFFDA